MALSIKTEEADRLARELSLRTGESLTEAVTVALRERLDRTAKPARQGPRRGEPGWTDHIRRATKQLMGAGPFAPYTKEEADEISDAGVQSYLCPPRP